MNPQLHQAVTDRLASEFSLVHNPQGRRLEKGECPQCGKNELWAFAEAPWMVRCNRLSKCGYEDHVKALFPDLFDTWSNRHPQTPENPHAAADAYLRDMRGFPLEKIAGWYSQEYYQDHEQHQGSATVRFAIPHVGFFERIIDSPWRFGSQKARIVGKYRGHWWVPPSLDLSKAETLWIAEGIFDAIALNLAGIPAVSSFSANHYPELGLKALHGLCAGRNLPQLVFALDGDKAGTHYTREFVKRARLEGWTATAASIPQKAGKLDWNDLYQRGKLSAEHQKDYLYHGALVIAATAQEKAMLIHQAKNWTSFSLHHDHRLYWFDLDPEKLAKEVEKLQSDHEDWEPEKCQSEAIKRIGNTRQIANCHPEPLYYQINKLTDECWYYFRVSFPHEGPDVKMTFTNGQLSSAPEFKKRLMFAPGAYWEGKPAHLDKLMSGWVYNIKTVQTIDFIGYAEDYGAYIFNDWAVKDGKLYPLNDQDFFDLGKNLSVKTLSQSVKLRLNTDPKRHKTDWLQPFLDCFGDKAMVALAYWLGTAFSCQIVDRNESFPFLAVTGAPGTGKSTVIQFLWKLFGRYGYEGFDAKKATASAFRRNMGQTTFAVVISESDRENVDGAHGRPASVFDWDQLKDAYMHGKIYSRGVKSNDNNTQEPDFKGAIVISQNAEVQASPAIQERIIDLKFTKDGQTEETNRLAEIIEHYEAQDVSHFLISLLLKEKPILAEYDKQYPRHYADLAKTVGNRHKISNFRTRRNHAQLKALIDCLALVLPLSTDQITKAQAFADTLAVLRELQLGKDLNILEEFWAVFDYLESLEGFKVNHSFDSGLIAINLNHFEQMANLGKQRIPLIGELKRFLRESKTHKFIDIKTVQSSINVAHNRQQEFQPLDSRTFRAETLKCWVFRR